MNVRVAVAIAVLVSVGRAAPAQVVELTEDDAVERLDASVATARRRPAGLAAAEGDLASARRLPDPRVEARREASLGIAERYFTVLQPLPITGRRGLEIGDAQRRLSAARLRAEGIDRSVEAELRLAFATLLAAQSQVEILQEGVARLRRLAEAIAEREKAGDAAGFDRLRAEHEVAALEASLADAAEVRTRAQADLAQFLGGGVDARALRALPPPADAAPAPLPEGDALVERALAERRELRALEHELEAARFARRAAGRLHTLEPEFVGGVKSDDSGDYGVFAVALTIPLFDRGAGERARLAGVERETGAAIAWEQARVRSEALALAAIVAERRAATKAFRDAAVAGAAELERIAELSYENRVRGILELLDAYRAGAGARGRLAELELATRRAEIELHALVGGTP